MLNIFSFADNLDILAEMSSTSCLNINGWWLDPTLMYFRFSLGLWNGLWRPASKSNVASKKFSLLYSLIIVMESPLFKEKN